VLPPVLRMGPCCGKFEDVGDFPNAALELPHKPLKQPKISKTMMLKKKKKQDVPGAVVAEELSKHLLDPPINLS
jgi:hypothetical protein